MKDLTTDGARKTPDPYWESKGTAKTDPAGTGAPVAPAPYEGVRYTGSAVDRAIQRRAQERALLTLIDASSRKDKVGESRARKVLMEKYNFSAKTLETLTAKIGNPQTGAKTAREAQDMGRAFLLDNDAANAKREQEEVPDQAEAPQGRGNAPEGATIVGKHWFQNVGGTVKSGVVDFSGKAETQGRGNAPEGATIVGKHWFQNVGGTVKSGVVDFSGKAETQGAEEPPKGGDAPAAAKAYQFSFTKESLSKSEWSKGAVASPNRISHAWGNGPQGISQRLLSGAALDAFMKEHPEAAKALGEGATAAQIDFRPVIGRDGKTSKWVASVTPFDMEKHIAEQAAKTQTNAAAQSLMGVFNAVNPQPPSDRNIGVDPNNPGMTVITFDDRGTEAYREADGDRTLFQRGTADQREMSLLQQRKAFKLRATPEQVAAPYDAKIAALAASRGKDGSAVLSPADMQEIAKYRETIPYQGNAKPLPLLRQATDALKRFSPF